MEDYNTFDFFLYHWQNVFYFSLLGILIVRLILNFIIYFRIDSDVVHREITFLESNNEIIYIVALTFWWPIEFKEIASIKRLKRFANILNILFAVLLPSALFFFLYMQEVNVEFEYVRRNPFYFLR